MSDTHGVSPGVTARLRLAHGQLSARASDTLRVAVEVGHILTEARGQCRHGEWGQYVQAHYEGSQREAQRYMRLAAAYPSPDDVPDGLSLRQSLAALTRGKRDEAPVTDNDRMTGDTAQAVAAAVGRMMEILDTEIVARLEMEGMTPRHPAMRDARSAGRAIMRLARRAAADSTAALVAESAELMAESRELRAQLAAGGGTVAK